MASIDISALSKSFPRTGDTPLAVLDNINIAVGDGQFACLLGPSGCGKSTTLDVLAGLTPGDTGTIRINGAPDDGSFTFGYVFQRPRLLNWRGVRGNLEFALRSRAVPREQWNSRIERYLALVGLGDFAEVFPLALSGGMQQRVALARAMVIEPDVLLMDEPFSSLDELTARRLRVELLDIVAEQEMTVLFVTHNALEAAFLADRIYVVSKRPATVLTDIEVGLARPREPRRQPTGRDPAPRHLNAGGYPDGDRLQMKTELKQLPVPAPSTSKERARDGGEANLDIREGYANWRHECVSTSTSTTTGRW